MSTYSVTALEFSSEPKGLQDFSRALLAGGVPHKIVEQNGKLCLLVSNEHYAQAVQAAWHSWQNGVQWQVVERVSETPLSLDKKLALGSIPTTLGLLLLSLLGYLVVFLVQYQVLPLDVFMLLVWSGWPEVLVEPWRIVTPIFLHFSLIHIAFNSLWCWELGKSIERQLGSVNLLGLVLLLAFVSNFAQGLVTLGGRFGGLSGVVYGLLGFNWLLARLDSKVRFDLPPAIMPFMIGWLLLCYTGIFSTLGIANIANEAHLAGLVGGFVFAVLFAAWRFVATGANR